MPATTEIKLLQAFFFYKTKSSTENKMDLTHNNVKRQHFSFYIILRLSAY